MSKAGENLRWLTADEAARRLKVKKETIYAYVSRGRLTTRRAEDGRGSLFDPVEIERLAAGTRQSANRAEPQEIESALTLIADHDHYYRGQSARHLADTRTYEEVAQLLWGVQHDGPWTPEEDILASVRQVLEVVPSVVLPIDEIKLAAACIAVLELPEWSTSPPVVAAAARRIFATLVSSLPQRSEPARVSSGDGPDSWLASMLWSRLCDRRPSDTELRLLNGTMIVLADHDIPSATMVARAAARAGVTVGSIIRLGADVGSGPVKGAASLAIETFLHNLESPDSVERALTMRLRQGEPIPGFGHAVYPAGDHRAEYVLERLRKVAAGSERLATVEQLIRMQHERGLPKPNAGFALAALSYVSGMLPGAGEAIFVISRAAGWIAHAIEEYSSAPPPRQRSRYTGPPVVAT